MELDKYIKEYKIKFKEAPFRIGFDDSKEEKINKLKYCLKNNVTMSYFYKYEDRVLY